MGGFDKAFEVTKDMLKLELDADINVEEYPKIYSNNFSFDDLNETPEFKVSSDLIPPGMDQATFIIDILPIIYSDDMLMIMPYELNVE